MRSSTGSASPAPAPTPSRPAGRRCTRGGSGSSARPRGRGRQGAARGGSARARTPPARARTGYPNPIPGPRTHGGEERERAVAVLQRGVVAQHVRACGLPDQARRVGHDAHDARALRRAPPASARLPGRAQHKHARAARAAAVSVTCSQCDALTLTLCAAGQGRASGRLASRLAMRTPAAMEMTRCRGARCGFSASRMLSRYCGFTCAAPRRRVERGRLRGARGARPAAAPRRHTGAPGGLALPGAGLQRGPGPENSKCALQEVAKVHAVNCRPGAHAQEDDVRRLAQVGRAAHQSVAKHLRCQPVSRRRLALLESTGRGDSIPTTLDRWGV